MPSVNTLIVDRADLLGLGQLHQIRGRVGPRRPAGLRLPLPPGRPGPLRAGLRAAADHRRAHRARLGLQDRHARPGDPRGGQPLGVGPVGAHRRRRLRPLRPAGGRGGGRGPGRGPARRRPRCRSTSRATPTCPRTTWRPRTPGSRRTAGWPSAPSDGRRRRHRGGVGRPLRTAARSGRRAPGAGPPARRRAGAGHPRGRHELGPRPAARASPWCGCRRWRSPPAPRCGCGAWPRAPPTARTWPSCWCPSPTGMRRPTPCARVIEELLPLRRCGTRRGHLVECAAREAAHRSPHRPGRRRRRGRVLGASNAATVNGSDHQPAGPQLRRQRHRRQRLLPVLPQLRRSTCRRTGASSCRRSRGRARASTPATTRPPPPPSWPTTSRPRSAISSCCNWRTSATSP